MVTTYEQFPRDAGDHTIVAARCIACFRGKVDFEAGLFEDVVRDGGF